MNSSEWSDFDGLYGIHPWRKLLGDLIEEMTADVFESMRIYTKQDIPRATWAETDVTGSYTQLSGADFALKKRKFFEALENFHGASNMPDMLMILCDHVMYHKTSGDKCESFATLIDDYKKQLAKYEEEIAKRGITLNDIFVGREEFILRVESDLFKPVSSITGVSICGMYGIGKTSVANHICVKHDRRMMAASAFGSSYVSIRIVLKGINSVESLLPKLWVNIFPGKPAKEMNNEIIVSMLQEIKTNTIIFMDNADDLLKIDNTSASNPTPNHERTRFIEFLSQLTGIQNPKVKILITSRYKLIEDTDIGDEPLSPRTPRIEGAIVEHELGSFTNDETKELLLKLAPKIDFTSEDLYNIYRDTGNSPFAIQMKANQYKLKRGDEVPEFDSEHPIQYTFNSLDDHWKEKLFALSIFESHFDSEAARALMHHSLNLDTLYDLQYLKSCHLVEVDDFSQLFGDDIGKSILMNRRENVRYSLHTLTKLFLEEARKRERSRYQQYIEEGERTYVKYFTKKWRELARIAKTNYLACSVQVEQCKLDIEKMLGMQSSCAPYKDKNFVHRQSDISEMYVSLDVFVNEYKRIQYFRSQAKAAKEQGQTLTFCNMKLWEILQHKQRGDYSKVRQMISMVEKKMAEVDTKKYSQAIEIQKAFIKFVQAEVISASQSRFIEAIHLLKESAEVYKAVLGNDTFTARVLNSIGSVNFQLARTEDIQDRKLEFLDQSIKYHEQAYEMLKIISPEGGHFDMPTYVMNVGTVFHVKGKFSQDRAENTVIDTKTAEELKAKADKHFGSAIKYYDKALAIDKRLKLDRYQRFAQILKNKATVLADKKEYETALEMANEALNIRRRCLSPLHPDRARISYLVGTLYMDIGKKQSVAGNKDGAKENWKWAESNFLDTAKYIMQSNNFPLNDRVIELLETDIGYIADALGKSSMFERYKLQFQRYLERRKEAEANAYETESDDSDYLNVNKPDLSALDSISNSSQSDSEKDSREVFIYESAKVETADGGRTAEEGRDSENVDVIYSRQASLAGRAFVCQSDEISRDPNGSTGDVNAAAIANTGDVNAAAIANTGDVNAAARANTGDVNAAAIANTGDVNAAATANTGDVNAAARANTGDVNAAARANTGDVNAAARANTGDVNAAARANTGDVNAAARANTAEPTSKRKLSESEDEEVVWKKQSSLPADKRE